MFVGVSNNGETFEIDLEEIDKTKLLAEKMSISIDIKERKV